MEINGKFSKEIIDKFHEIHDGNNDNLKNIPPVFLKAGMGYMDILVLTRAELGLGLGEAIMLLEIPDAVV
ncbi:hypothetical protein [Chitinophaga pinensis]|uniref:Uncharacterized protein n=1 Tax=Chitinophaga pinensis (strain ATCC 43595 / DSM 2588 / LMG 13176 / NBRC 15968 / NCIMB 11800 / UQM 2034) TaxID=485918 RepID=A0A979GQG8_CHIPD|nr:hypothetical protein [Chitinophaga pinensis]ACU60018.1 hypothetical protein Cpin_2534 [Chitinophaga pinensis DSM 2588]